MLSICLYPCNWSTRSIKTEIKIKVDIASRMTSILAKKKSIWKYYEIDILECKSLLSEHEKELGETNGEN